MNKIAQYAEVLSDVPGTLRELAAENKELTEKVAQYELRTRVEKLAAVMHSKNLNTDTPLGDLADNLEKSAAAGKLDAIEAGVELVGPDMGQKLAQLTSDERGSSGSSTFEQFIVGGVG
jgi:hypothetical protein